MKPKHNPIPRRERKPLPTSFGMGEPLSKQIEMSEALLRLAIENFNKAHKRVAEMQSRIDTLKNKQKKLGG